MEVDIYRKLSHNLRITSVLIKRWDMDEVYENWETKLKSEFKERIFKIIVWLPTSWQNKIIKQVKSVEDVFK